MRRVLFALMIAATTSAFVIGFSPAFGQGKDKAATPAKPVAKAAPKMTVHGNLAQLMRGVFYPASNVIFAAQGTDPKEIKQAKEPSTATDPLQSSYGGWLAVENASLALADGANLLLIPGRTCANGKAVPINAADWPGFVQGLKDAGKKAYDAAKAKDQDKILDAADAMTTACSNCHDKYREPTPRCQP